MRHYLSARPRNGRVFDAKIGAALLEADVREVVISAGNVSVRARLLNTPTAERIWQALPIHAAAQTWGAEVYFQIQITSDREPNARETIKAGEIAFWPDGDAIAIGFGPTPISRSSREIRFVSPCNVWAQALDDVKAFRSVHPGEAISVLAA